VLPLRHLHRALQVSITSSAALQTMPVWMATSAAVTGTTVCSGLPTVVIASLAEYTSYIQSTPLSTATTLGSVIITWAGMNNARLTTVLAGKTSLDMLVIALVSSLTNLSPALDNLTMVTMAVVVDNCVNLANAEMASLTTVGTGVRLYNLARLRSISMPQLTTIGGTLYLTEVRTVRFVDFDSLAAVGGSLYLRNMQYLSGDALSDGFSNLQSVGGTLSFNTVSTHGTLARSSITLPQLVSVGAWSFRSMSISAAGFPMLTSVNGTFAWVRMTSLRAMHLPSLAVVRGAITLNTLPMLLDLCSVGLDLPGYLASQSIVITGTASLAQSPSWIATNASLTGMAPCSNLPGVLIASTADYTRFTQDAALMNAVELGSVVITWTNMTNERLGIVMANKATLGGLVLALLPSVTTLSPALDNVTSVASGVVLDNLIVLTSATMNSLTSCGAGGVRIYNNPRLLRITMPQLTTVGNLYLASLTNLRVAALPALISVTGTLTMYNMRYLSPMAVSNGLPSLETVSGQLRLDRVAWWNAASSRGPITLPELQSVGSLYIRHSYMTTLSLDSLVTVTGGIYMNSASRLTAIHLPSLQSVGRAITLITMPLLTNLCHLGLTPSAPHGQVRATAPF
jgi:hypothetical protein